MGQPLYSLLRSDSNVTITLQPELSRKMIINMGFSPNNRFFGESFKVCVDSKTLKTSLTYISPTLIKLFFRWDKFSAKTDPGLPVAHFSLPSRTCPRT